MRTSYTLNMYSTLLIDTVALLVEAVLYGEQDPDCCGGYILFTKPFN